MGSQCPEPGRHRNTIFVWGDSHARAIAPGFADWARAHGWAYALYAEPGCTPLPGTERTASAGAIGWTECEPVIRRGWEYARDNSDVKIVVIAGRWARVAATYPERPDHRTYLRPKDSGLPVSTALSQQTFDASLSGLVKDLTNLGKTVILVGATPELPVDPQRCLANFDSLPVRRWFALPCDADAQVVENSTAFLTGSLRAMAQKNPRTCLVAPAAFLCDSAACRVQKNGLTYYRDADHLTASGARSILAQAQPVACLDEALKRR